MREAARMAAQSGAEELISGPPGAGTSKLAEVIHLLSETADGPFVKLGAAAATPESLTAAFERAKGGSLFLDEVAALSPPAQAATLERIEADTGARVLAGTYPDLAAETATGGFAPDLYHKLDVIRVRIPPLRDRPEDIPVLFRHCVALACEQSGQPEPEITQDVLTRLMGQDWPGNARALMGEAMRYVLGHAGGAAALPSGLGLGERMAQPERSFLIDALSRTEGNATAAATELKLPRKTFYDKLARHGIRPEDHRG